MHSSMSVCIESRIYSPDGKFLLCVDNTTGKQCFRKAFSHPRYETLNNLDICEVHLSPDGKGIVVLFEMAPSGYKTVGNLACVTSAGEVMWWAELPDTGNDNFVAVEVKEGKIFAWSWSCQMCGIDPQTGHILSKIFTK
jgi:hypothetical protein